MIWKNVFSSYRPQMKCDPLSGSIGAALAPAAVNTVGNLVSSLFGQSSQKEENAKNRSFALEMWNLQNAYNSPKNQRKLLEEGGYSPYLFNDTAPFSTAGTAPSPSTSPLPTFQNPFNGSMQLLQNGLQVEANVELQRMKSLEAVADLMVNLYKEGGQSQVDEFMHKFAPALESINFSGSFAEQRFHEFLLDEKSKRYNTDMDSLNKELDYELSKEFTPQQIKAGLEKTQYDISEIVGRLATMNIQNEALMKRTAAECIESMASAFNLRKSGAKYAADAKTANLFRDTLHRIIKGEATVKERDAYFATADKDSASDLVGFMISKEGRERRSKEYQITMEQRASQLIRATDKVFGEYFNTNFSYGNSKSVIDATSHNYSESYVFKP